jgi:hypothetical protein
MLPEDRTRRCKNHDRKPSTSLRCPLEKVATLDTLADFQGFAGDETPKVANPLKGHVSESTADERRHDVFEERSGVLEFDAGLTREEAEALAAESCIRNYRTFLTGGRAHERRALPILDLLRHPHPVHLLPTKQIAGLV